MPDRGLWISGVILIAWILTTIGLIAFGVFTRLPRGDTEYRDNEGRESSALTTPAAWLVERRWHPLRG
jgi:hypothetical protein